jgi:predicted ABC-type ATPase
MPIFLKLASVELAIERVAARVAQGGHAIPESVIRRRFVAGWYHFEHLYRPRLDAWRVYDNSGEEATLLEEAP